MVRNIAALVVEPLDGDILTALQCVAIDADAFPYPHANLVLAARDAEMRVWVARDRPAKNAEAGRAGRVIGFLSAKLSEEALWIVALATDRAERRRGVARALLQEAKRSAPMLGLGRLVLQVGSGNTVARALYESEGFRVSRLRRDYYRARVEGGPDALEMVCSLWPA